MPIEPPPLASLGALTSVLAKALRLSHLTIESSPDLVFWVSQQGVVQRVNRGATHALGVNASKLLERDFGDVVELSERDVLCAAMQDALKGGEPVHVESVFVRDSGDGFPVDVMLIRVDVDDGQYACVLARDVSDKKRDEERLAAAVEELSLLKDKLQLENTYLKSELQKGFAGVIGDSAAMRHMMERIEQVAPGDTTVLILGESGTGKELLAQAIHRGSRRRDMPLVTVNCAALPENLIESELFGHEKGAFTNAVADRVGRFELADGGTIFLDEIGELPMALQAKLLRVLQGAEFQRVGSSTTRRVDVRLLAATNQGLPQAIEQGRFRADLFYRLNVFPLEAPPLRDRSGDVLLLAAHFLACFSKRNGKKIAGISPRMQRSLNAYAWPGNVRELENVIERAVILHRSGDSLDHPIEQPSDSSAIASDVRSADVAIPTMRAVEIDLIERALRKCNWMVGGKGGAARVLDMPPTTLRERMVRYGIQRPVQP